MGHRTSHAARAVAIVVAALTALTGALLATPARAGQDITIELHNELPKTQPLYPRLALRGTDSLCWYSQDFSRDDLAAPAGGGYANITSEVRNTFFSMCNPTFNPLKDTFARWQKFTIVAQSEPGGPWTELTWGDNYSAFFLSYWKMLMDPRGYHFDLTRPAAGTVLQTPVGKACVTADPWLFNYTDLFSMTVSKAQDGSCPSAPTARRLPTQDRKVPLKVGRTRQVVVGQVTAGTRGTTWKVRRGQCTSDHFAAEAVRIRRGPGGSRWQVVAVRGTSPGRDTCVIDLVGAPGPKVMSQRVALTVR